MHATIALILLVIGPASAFDCALCPASASPCCGCCVGGALQPGLCNAPALASCVTPTATGTALTRSVSASTTFSPLATRAAPRDDPFAAVFGTGCVALNWTVPAGVTNVTVTLWGSGGSNGAWVDGALKMGGSGAYVQGVAPVAPLEVLEVRVGGTACGGSSSNGAGVSGGASTVARRNGSLLAVAAGGGAISSGYACWGDPGLGIPVGGCGVYAPQGTSGGGGGWVGGGGSPTCWYGGAGGTSCAPGLLPASVVSVSGSVGFAALQQSPLWRPRVGVGGGSGGLIAFSWYAPNASATPSPTVSAAQTPSNGPTPSPWPTPVTAPPGASSLTLAAPCVTSYWVVPPGVTAVTVTMWGSGGLNAYGLGGAGAFLAGTAYVTPSETLRVLVGGTAAANDQCGGGSRAGSSVGGGRSAVSRYSVATSTWEVLAVAAGGGGGSSGYSCSGDPGRNLTAVGGCGVYAPQGTSGGGGGWVGGGGSPTCWYGGAGGTSCAPGLLPASVVSVSGGLGGIAPMQSALWAAGAGAGGGSGGRVVLQWVSGTPPATSSATISRTPTASPATPPPTASPCVVGSSAATAAAHCGHARAACGFSNATFWLASPVGGAPYRAYCAGDGWVLALRVNGAAGTFAYESPLWTSATLLNDAALDPAGALEAKLAPFVDTPGAALRIEMTAPNGLSGAPLVLPVPGGFSSLRALLAGGSVATAAPLGAWYALVPGGATYQRGCNAQGVNVATPWMSFRIGIVWNEGGGCESPDTALGLGGSVFGGWSWSWTSGQFVGCCFQEVSGSVYGGTTPGWFNVYVAGPVVSLTPSPPASAPPTTTPSATSTASLSFGASPSGTGSNSPTGSLSSTGSGTVTPTRTVSSSPTASRSPSRSAPATRSATRSPAGLGVQAAGATRQLVGRFLRVGVNSMGTLGSVGSTAPGIQWDERGKGEFTDALDSLVSSNRFEGWALKFNRTAGATPAQYSNNNVGPSTIPGVLSILSGLPFRGETWDHRAVWVGSLPGIVTVTHDVRFNHSDQAIRIVTEVTAAALLPCAFFARIVNPGALRAPGDSVATRNARGWGPIPPSNIVLSEALVSGYTLGLMSSQKDGSVGTGISSARTRDPELYYRGAAGSAMVGDDTIGIGFALGDLAANRSVQVTYSYVFGAGLLPADPSVTLRPTSGSMLGGTLVTVAVPEALLLATDGGSLQCRWGSDAAGFRDAFEVVPATLAGNASATCAAPFSLKLGPATVWFSTARGASWVYVGVFTYVAPDAGGLAPLFLRPSGSDSGSTDGGPLLWPSLAAATAPLDASAPRVLSLTLAWLLSSSELAAVSTEALFYTAELFEIVDTLGSAAAWVGASGPLYRVPGGASNTTLPPVTATVQNARAAAEVSSHAALLLLGTAVSSSGVRLLGAVDTPLLGFGMTFDEGVGDVAGYVALTLPLNASFRSPLAVRPVFVRLTARDAARGGMPLHVRASNLRWLLPGPPNLSTSVSPSPRSVTVSPSRPASPSAAPALDAHAACVTWKALQVAPTTWNRGLLPQCPQVLAQVSLAQWTPVGDCAGRNGSIPVAGAAVSGSGSGDSLNAAGDAWGTAPCWMHRGRAAFGEVGARSCFHSTVPSANYAAASCCYDAAGRLLRAGSGSASDARFAPSPARLSHVFADQLPRLVCCRLSGVREDCDGVVRASGGFSWRGAGGAAGDPHFVTLDGHQLTLNGIGDHVYLGVKTAAWVATPPASALVAAAVASPGDAASRLLTALNVSALSFVRLLPLSALFTDGPSVASAVRGWSAVTINGETASVTVRGGQLQVHVDGFLVLPPLEQRGGVAARGGDGFAGEYLDGRAVPARSGDALAALARTSRLSGSGDGATGTAVASAEAAARAALAAGLLDGAAADETHVVVGNISVVFSRTQRQVRVALPHVGIAVTVSQQARSAVAALDGTLLVLSADVASTQFNCTFGLMGDFDGQAANDAAGPTEAAAYAALSAALGVPGGAAAFPEPLPPLPASFVPAFAASLPDPAAALVQPSDGALPPLLAACGIPADTSAPVASLPFAQAACYFDGSVTGALDVAASTLTLVRELQAASAAAHAPAPEFLSPPANLTLAEGATGSVALVAGVPSLVPGPPSTLGAVVVSFRVESAPGGACRVHATSGLLQCGPLRVDDAGLTLSFDGSIATGSVVVAAAAGSAGAESLLQLPLVVLAAATITPSSTLTDSSSGTARATGTATCSSSVGASGSGSGSASAAAPARSASASAAGSASSASASVAGTASIAASAALAPSTLASPTASASGARVSSLATAAASVFPSTTSTSTAAASASWAEAARSSITASPLWSSAAAVNASAISLAAAASAAAQPMAPILAGAAVAAVCVAAAAFTAYRRTRGRDSKLPRGRAATPAGTDGGVDRMQWHDHASINAVKRAAPAAPLPSTENPLLRLHAQHAVSMRRVAPMGGTPARAARASFAPQAAHSTSNRALELPFSPAAEAAMATNGSRRHLGPMTAVLAAPSPSTRNLLALEASGGSGRNVLALGSGGGGSGRGGALLQPATMQAADSSSALSRRRLLPDPQESSLSSPVAAGSSRNLLAAATKLHRMGSSPRGPGDQPAPAAAASPRSMHAAAAAGLGHYARSLKR